MEEEKTLTEKKNEFLQEFQLLLMQYDCDLCISFDSISRALDCQLDFEEGGVTILKDNNNKTWIEFTKEGIR